jgi:hypothetical protein
MSFMKTMLTTQRPEISYDSSGLHELADFLVSKFVRIAASNRSVFVNEIPTRLPLSADKQMLTSVLNGLFSAVITNATDSCIKLSAKRFGNSVLLQVEKSSGLKNSSFENEVRKLQPLAAKMRGSVEVTRHRKKLTTITFGFPNLPM